jgi:thiamine biosynthesis protein ThiI
MQVNLKHPELEVQISLEYKNTWISLETWPGAGGMPLLGDSRHLLLLSGGIDSPVAGNLIQKRGGTLAAVHFHTPPYTQEAAREKAHDLASLLARFQGELTLFQIPITRFMQRILAECQQRYAIILARRFMLALAGELARRHRLHSLVTGESLGQVASQTIQNMAVIEQGCELPILRPLIGFDKLEIVARAISLGSFAISTRPEQDCCSLFAPGEPVTKASLSLVQAMEAALPMALLIEEALGELECGRLVCDYAQEIRP